MSKFLEEDDVFLTMHDVEADNYFGAPETAETARKTGPVKIACCHECGIHYNGFNDQFGAFYCITCWKSYATKPTPAVEKKAAQRKKRRKKKRAADAKKAKSAATVSQLTAKPKTHSRVTLPTSVPTTTSASAAVPRAKAFEETEEEKEPVDAKRDLFDSRPSFLSAFGKGKSDFIADESKAKSKSKRMVTAKSPESAQHHSDIGSSTHLSPSSQPVSTSSIATSVSSAKVFTSASTSGMKMRGMKLESSKDRRRHDADKRQLLEAMFEEASGGKVTAAGTKKRKAKTHKSHLNLVVVGHVDHGKSTLMGHVLYALGTVSRRQMHKFKKESQDMGKASFAYAWVLDQHSEERSRGVTVDVSVNHFTTAHRSVTLLDSPGHRDFIPNMISGASQADCCILVVSAIANEFDSGFKKAGQTREHAILVKSLGVSQLIVAINKMDMVSFSKEAFDNVKSQLSVFLKEIGFSKAKTTFVPVSGLQGDNLVPATCKAPLLEAWFKGPTLSEAIDRLKPPASLFEKCRDRPMRLCVTDVFKDITMGGTVITGKVVSGCVVQREQILIQPSGLLTRAKGIFNVDGSQLSLAIVGSNVQVNVPVKDEEDLADIKPGDVICSPFDRPLKPCLKFRCKIAAMPSLTLPICKGHELIAHIQSVSAPCVVHKLNYLIDKTTGVKLETRSAKSGKKLALRHIKSGQTAMITLSASNGHLFCLDTFDKVKPLGRVTLRREGVTVAVGQIARLY